MIQHRAFRGSSAAEAMQKATAELGEDIAVVTTKQLQAKTLTKKAEYEVIIAYEAPDPAPTFPKPKADVNEIKRQIEAYTKYGERPASAPARPDPFAGETPLSPISSNLNNGSNLNTPAPQNEAQNQGNSNLKDDSNLNALTRDTGDASISISGAAIVRQAADEIRRATGLESAPRDYSREFHEMQKQIRGLNERLTSIADAVWESGASSRGDLLIPPEFATIYKLAKLSGMKEEHLKAVMEETNKTMPAAWKNNPATVKKWFKNVLKGMIPCRKEKFSGNRHIKVLVGPTGVGKTTTLAKLAWRLAYNPDSSRKKERVGIITLDSYRIGAAGQLSEYAGYMQLPILTAINEEDFVAAIRSLRNCDIILVDTAGSSQYDRARLERLNNILSVKDELLEGWDVEVDLVLSAGSKVEDLLEIYDSFSFLKINTLIVTKFDETKIFGNVLSLVYETGTPVSYFSVGQEVPEDIMEADGEFLVKCVLEGFGKGKSDE